ncbi:MAG: 4Fe-4S binding protein [Candidatus Eisenbacteria bacterium]|nr:4Fe-4S binding protein [Candidatus Eisenbacteria bacterium]
MPKVAGKVEINQSRCKGCELCVSVCPLGVLGMSEDFGPLGYHPAVAVNMDACNGCTLCALICPDMAIEVFKE